MLLTKQLLVATDFHSMGKNSMEVRKLWVNEDKVFICGWSIQLGQLINHLGLGEGGSCSKLWSQQTIAWQHRQYQQLCK